MGRRGLTFWGPVCFDGCSFRHGCARRGREPRGHQRDRGPDPGLFNPDTTNLGTKIISLYLWRAIAVLSLVYAWLCFPKTAAWTREKLDEMFIKGVPARKFKTYKPDAEVRCEEAQARLQ